MFNSYPQLFNYLLLACAIIPVIMKIFHDVYNYRSDKALQGNIPNPLDHKKYAKLAKPFGFLMIYMPVAALPVFLFLVPYDMYLDAFMYYILGSLFMYSWIIDTGFIIGTDKKFLYIGKTAWWDRFRRHMFNIKYKGDPGYDQLNPKQVQRLNFRKFFYLFFLPLIITVFGAIMIIDFI